MPMALGQSHPAQASELHPPPHPALNRFGRVLAAGFLLGSLALPLRADNLSDALDAPQLLWRTGTNAPWFGQTTNTHDGVGAAQSGPLTASGQSSWLETTVTGRVTVLYWWKLSADPAWYTFSLQTNGASVEGYYGELDWQPGMVSFARGTNVLRWSYTVPPSDPTHWHGNAAWLDQVLVTNIAGLAPVFLTPPAPAVVAPEYAPYWTNLSALVVGDIPVSYQWQRNGTNLTEGWPFYRVRTPALTFYPRTEAETGGEYRLVASNAWSMVTSSVCTVSIVPSKPFVHPDTPYDGLIALGAYYSLSVSPSGSPPFRYQWLKDGNPIPGATLYYYSFWPAALEDTGGYSVVVTNDYGVATSRVAQVIVSRDPPHIVTEPDPQQSEVMPGGYASFYMYAEGPQSLSYQWRKVGADTELAGNSSLEFNPVDATNSGLYYVVVANNNGAVTSRVSVLAVPPATVLGLALNAPDLVMTNDWWWNQWTAEVERTNAHDGVCAVRSCAIGDWDSSSFSTAVAGPANVSFWWRISAADQAYLDIFVDGSVSQTISGETLWQQQTLHLPPGKHTLTWTYRKESAGIVGQDAAWVDQFLIGDAPIVGTEITNFTTSGASPPWYLQTTTTHDGVAAWQSGAIGDNQSNALTATVSGPGTLTFWWQVESEEGADFLRFGLDGVSQTNISGRVNWHQQSYVLGSGSHELEWAYTKDGGWAEGADAGWVDEVMFTPTILPPTLEQALNVTNLTFTTGGDAPWWIETTNTHDGVMALQSGPIGDNQQSWLRTMVTGPGTLTFWYATSTEVGGDWLSIPPFGSFSTTWGGDLMVWTSETLTIPAGPHTLEWTYQKDSSGSGGSDAVWLDQMTFTPAALPATLEQALNVTNLTFTTGGDAPWWVETTNTHDGVAALQSGVIGDYQQSWLETTLTGPGTLTFWWAVESESCCDFLRVAVDEVLRTSIAGSVAWRQESLVLSAGNHTVRWFYVKDGSAAAPRDAGWLDEVTWTPAPPPTLAEALDAPAYEFHVTENAPYWYAQTTNTHDGMDAVQGTAPPVHTEYWLYTTITGPGTLTFWAKISAAPEDALEFYMDSRTRYLMYGEFDWRQFTYEIGPGSVGVAWAFWKSSAESAGLNAVFLDEIIFTPRLTPSITASPQPVKLRQGRSFGLSVTAVGDPPLRYQWLREGTNLPGATGTNFTRSVGRYEDTGNYAVTVANAAGAVTSSVARVVVAPFFYSARNLGTLKSGTVFSSSPSEAFDINNAGEVVGQSVTDEVLHGELQHGFVWVNGDMTDLGDGRNALNVAATNRLPGTSCAYSINDHFEIAGYYEYRVNPAGDGYGHAAYWRSVTCGAPPGSWGPHCPLELVDVHPRDIYLYPPDTYAVALNSSRQMILQAARVWTPADYGYLLTPNDPSSPFTSFTTRQLSSSGGWVMPYALNNSGLIAGWYREYVGGEMPFLYDGINKVGSAALTNLYWGILRSVNDRGVVAGHYSTSSQGFNVKRPFRLYPDGRYETLTNSAGGLWSFEVRDLNNRNQLVGINFANQGTLYHDGFFFTLNDLVLENLVNVMTANAINDRGQIVGVAWFPYGNGNRACLLTPTSGGANQSPVAADDEFRIPKAQSLRLPTARLLANDSDPDGDVLSVVALGETTTATTTATQSGGKVSLQADAIFYIPPSGVFATDQFSYTVSDGLGETATARVTLVLDSLAPAPELIINPPQKLPDGTFLLSGSGPAGSLIIIYVAREVRASYWTRDSVVTVPTSGHWSVIRPGTLDGQPVFYKAEIQ